MGTVGMPIPGTKIKIPYSAMVYAHSGLTGCDGKNIVGYLHRAVKPANQLKMLEDAMVIYRITRAPDRRIFYIDNNTCRLAHESQIELTVFWYVCICIISYHVVRKS
jgi:hypothetical protein